MFSLHLLQTSNFVCYGGCQRGLCRRIWGTIFNTQMLNVWYIYLHLPWTLPNEKYIYHTLNIWDREIHFIGIQSPPKRKVWKDSSTGPFSEGDWIPRASSKPWNFGGEMLAFLGDLCDMKKTKNRLMCQNVDGFQGRKRLKHTHTHTLVSPHQTTSSCIHRGKLTAGTWTSPVWKGTSSEPNLHFFRLHVKFRGCSYSFHSFPYLLYSLPESSEDWVIGPM